MTQPPSGETWPEPPPDPSLPRFRRPRLQDDWSSEPVIGGGQSVQPAELAWDGEVLPAFDPAELQPPRPARRAPLAPPAAAAQLATAASAGDVTAAAPSVVTGTVSKTAVAAAPPYPVAFEVVRPRQYNRPSALLRPLLVIPLVPVVLLLWLMLVPGMILGWLAVFVRRSYPEWLFTAMSGGLAQAGRIQAYGTLLTDQFPPFDAGGPVRLEFATPEPWLSRWRVLFWKAVLLGPQLVVFAALWLVALATTMVAWAAILFTGHYPRGLFDFSVGVQRWGHRLTAYFASFTDLYPPFSTEAGAPAASLQATAVSGVLGLLVLGLAGGAFAGYQASLNDRPSLTVEYTALQAGFNINQPRFYTGDPVRPDFAVMMTGVDDDNRGYRRQFDLGARRRVVVFEFLLINETGDDVTIQPDDFWVHWDAGNGAERSDPVLVLLGGQPTPRELPGVDGFTKVNAVFELPAGADISELWIDPDWPGLAAAVVHFQ